MRFLTALALCLAAPAQACDTALVLAIDVSGSVDAAEYALQAGGLADALGDPGVVEALVRGQMALAVVQWSGVGQQRLVQPWRRLLAPSDVNAFARAARAASRAYVRSDTAVGAAMDFAMSQFAAVGDCRRRVIDISGDGQENAGFTAKTSRATAQEEGIEINAVAIEDPGASAPITGYFRGSVITRGGFVLTARGLSDYPRAIREKLLRELTKPVG